MAATHGVFAPPAIERLVEAPIEEIVVTDTIPQHPEAQALKNLKVVSVANLLGEAIHRIHNNQSVSEIFNKSGNDIIQ